MKKWEYEADPTDRPRFLTTVSERDLQYVRMNLWHLDHLLDISTKNGKLISMNFTITLGKSGCLVVPKAIRDTLGLREGSRLKLEIQGGKIEAEPECDPVSITLIDGFPVISGTPALAKGDTVAAIKAGREERQQRLLPESR